MHILLVPAHSFDRCPIAFILHFHSPGAICLTSIYIPQTFHIIIQYGIDVAVLVELIISSEYLDQRLARTRLVLGYNP